MNDGSSALGKENEKSSIAIFYGEQYVNRKWKILRLLTSNQIGFTSVLV